LPKSGGQRPMYTAQCGNINIYKDGFNRRT
jgi:hypothetical protein